MLHPSESSPKSKTERFAPFVAALLPLVYFLPAVAGRLVLSPDDALLFNTPLRVMWAEMVRSGSLPLWNPYIFGGMPLLAAAQGGVLFPLNWLYILLPPTWAVNLTVLATYSLASLGAYLYTRRTGLGVAAALTTGVVWTFCGFMVAHIGHVNAIQVAALMPWLLWALDGYGTKGGRARGALIAVTVALQVFAGHQQTLVYVLLVAASYSIVMGRATNGAARSRYLLSLALMALGLLLAAVQILPTLELIRNSLRASASYEFFSSFSLPPGFSATLLAPYLVGGGDGRLFAAPYIGEPFYGEYIGYVGIATLALAALALRFKADARTLFWTAVALVAIVLAFGRFLPLDLYRIFYHVPVLNLFRVPARHLMEFDFALAVLAGRGVAAIFAARPTRAASVKSWAVATGILLLLLASAVVTVGRPAGFRLWRDAPVTLLRAPELFMPPLIAFVTALALWLFARKASRKTFLLLFSVLAFDLALWGHSSGWAVSSPRPDDAYWREPVSMRFVRGATNEPFRLLTVQQPLDPIKESAAHVESHEAMMALSPNMYMMHGVQNAAGYDGFGLARYSRLAGNMKLWGDFESPRETLGEASRALDLLNVRYLFIRNYSHDALEPVEAKKDDPAIVNIGGNYFASQDLSLPELNAGHRLSFDVPRTRAKRFAIVSNLSWSTDVKEGTTIARVRLLAEDGREFALDVRAGEHTAEWALDRSDIKARIRHERPPLATSYWVEDPQAGDYEAHSYLASFKLPERAVIIGGEIEVASISEAPMLGFKLLRATLMDEEPKDTVPIRNEWFSDHRKAGDEKDASALFERWRPVGEYGSLQVYENARALPRVWLASSSVVLPDAQILDVVRAGTLPDGSAWDPRRTALVENPLATGRGVELPEGSGASVVEYEPNRVTVKTSAPVPSLLVLSENHYPGWRAYVDGRRVEVARVNYNLRGVELPAGEHTVVFRYLPGSVLVGIALSFMTAAALLIWVFLPRSRPFGASSRGNEDSALN